MRPTVKNRQKQDQLRTKTEHRKKDEEKNWCDKDRRERESLVLGCYQKI